jgi:hypothetical protein
MTKTKQESAHEYYMKNRERLIAYQKKYKTEHKDKWNQYQRNKAKEYYETKKIWKDLNKSMNESFSDIFIDASNQSSPSSSSNQAKSPKFSPESFKQSIEQFLEQPDSGSERCTSIPESERDSTSRSATNGFTCD